MVQHHATTRSGGVPARVILGLRRGRHRRPLLAHGAHRAPATVSIGTALLASYRRQALAAALAASLAMLLVDTAGGGDPAGNVAAVQAADSGPATGGATSRSGRRAPANKDAPRTPRARTAPDAGDPTPGPATPTTEPTQKEAGRARSSAARSIGPAGSLLRTGSDAVALTFDDGPDPLETPRLLDLLAEHDVKATFCVVGSRAKAFPELVRRIAADGHALCNHSWRHDFSLGRRTLEDIQDDLAATNEAIRAAAPDARIGYFRAPGGHFTKRLVAAADTIGMRSIYWDVDPRDWERPEGEGDEEHVDRIVADVRKNTRAGSIVLSHDFRQPLTVEAYERLLPALADRFRLTALP